MSRHREQAGRTVNRSVNAGGLGVAILGVSGAGFAAEGLWFLDGLWAFLAIVTIVAAALAVARLVPRRER